MRLNYNCLFTPVLLAGGFRFHVIISSTDLLDIIKQITSLPPITCLYFSCVYSGLFEIRMVSHSGNIHNGAFEIPAAHRDVAAKL